MKSLSRVRLFATPWTVAYQAFPSMGFSRQKYWSGLPFPSPNTNRGAFNSDYRATESSSVFPYSSISFCLICFDALLLAADILRIVLSSWRIIVPTKRVIISLILIIIHNLISNLYLRDTTTCS